MALLGQNIFRRSALRTWSRGSWTARLALCGLLLLVRLPGGAQEIQAPEYKLKAAFLYNFTKLVEWPGSAFTNSSAPLVIGVLGKDPFGKELDNLIAGRRVKGRRLEAARFNLVEEITNCHVLFISESERRKLDTIFDALQGSPCLTVGDMSSFNARGMITLVKTNDTIDLRINLEPARLAGLQFSSRLTRLDQNQRPLGGGSTNTPPATRN